MVSDEKLIEVIEKQTEVNTKILDKLDTGFANNQKTLEMGFANLQKSLETGFANTQKSLEMGFANTREGFANTQKNFDKLDNHLTDFKKEIVDKYADFHKTMIRIEVLMGVLVAIGIAAVLNMFGIV